MPVLKEVLRNFTFANQLTFLRLVAIPLFIIALFTNRPRLALGLFLAAGLTDALDGLIARYLRQTTALGAFLDPLADKLMITAAFIALTMPDHPKALPDYTAANHIPIWLTILTISRDTFIVITATLLYFVYGIRRFPPTVLGKATTFMEIATVLAFLLGNVGGSRVDALIALSWVTVALVVASGFHYIYRTGAMVHAAQLETDRRSPE
jgi:cardiolipin synthase